MIELLQQAGRTKKISRQLCSLCEKTTDCLLTCQDCPSDLEIQCAECSSTLHSFPRFQNHQVSVIEPSLQPMVLSPRHPPPLKPITIPPNFPNFSQHFCDKEEFYEREPPLSPIARRIVQLLNQGRHFGAFILARQNAIEDGDAAALLAICFSDGLGSSVDKPQGKRWAALAMESNSLFGRGMCAFLHQDYDLAQKIFFPFAQPSGLNLSVAQRCISKCLYAQKKDPELGFWYDTLASNQGYVIGQYNLAVRFCGGRTFGVQEENIPLGIQHYQIAQDKCYSAAQTNLGLRYSNGNGVSENLFRGISYFRRAADHGDVLAQVHLGYCYFNGKGVVPDSKIGTRFFSLAAQQGDADALECLAGCYLEGEGTEHNPSKAVSLFYQSAQLNHPPAFGSLGWCSLKGYGLPESVQKAVTYFQIGADLSDDFCQYQLGLLFMSGKGVEKNMEKAREYFAQSAAQGNEIAVQKLSELNEE